jgi:hypothetical protein
MVTEITFCLLHWKIHFLVQICSEISWNLLFSPWTKKFLKNEILITDTCWIAANELSAGRWRRQRHCGVCRASSRWVEQNRWSVSLAPLSDGQQSRAGAQLRLQYGRPGQPTLGRQTGMWRWSDYCLQFHHKPHRRPHGIGISSPAEAFFCRSRLSTIACPLTLRYHCSSKRWPRVEQNLSRLEVLMLCYLTYHIPWCFPILCHSTRCNHGQARV